MDLISLHVTPEGAVEERCAERFPDRALRHPARLRGRLLPETNALVPLGSYADVARTPTSKSIPVTLIARDEPGA